MELTVEEKKKLYKEFCGEEITFYEGNHKHLETEFYSETVTDTNYNKNDKFLRLTFYVRNDINYYLSLLQFVKSLTSLVINTDFYKIYSLQGTDCEKREGSYYFSVSYNIE